MNKKLIQQLKDNKGELIDKGIHLHDDHALPQTRRELLATGLIGAGYTVMLPSVGSLMLQSKEAYAQGGECPAKIAPAGVPFIQMMRNGGCRVADQFAFGLNRNGAPGDYTRPGGGFNDTDLFSQGIAPDEHPSKSGKGYLMLGGHEVPRFSAALLSAQQHFGTMDLNSVFGNKVNIFSFISRTPDDTGSSLQNFLASVRLLRNNADFNIVSSREGTNGLGVRALPAFAVEERSNVVRGTDISALTDMGINADADVKRAFIEKIASYAKSRVTSKDAQRLIGCSSNDAANKVIEFSSAIDPRSVPEIAAVFPEGQNDSLASMMYMLNSNMALCAGIDAGGFDYHGNMVTPNYARDFAFYANNVWPAVDVALRLNKPLIISLGSDGSTRCANSEQELTLVTPIGAETTVAGASHDGDFGRNGSMLLIAVGDFSSQLQIKHHQSGFSLAGGGAARQGNLIGFDQAARSSVILETIRRLMEGLNPSNKPTATFQDASGGARLNAALEPFVPVKKV